MTVEESNLFIQKMEKEGFRLWNDHPGYTIGFLNGMLEIHGLKIEVVEEGDNLWVRIKKVP